MSGVKASVPELTITNMERASRTGAVSLGWEIASLLHRRRRALGSWAGLRIFKFLL